MKLLIADFLEYIDIAEPHELLGIWKTDCGHDLPDLPAEQLKKAYKLLEDHFAFYDNEVWNYDHVEDYLLLIMELLALRYEGVDMELLLVEELTSVHTWYRIYKLSGKDDFYTVQ